MVRRCLLDVGDPQNTYSNWHQHWTERNSLLGHRYWWFRSDSGIYRRALFTLVSVWGLLPAISLSWPQLEIAPALGMEYRGPRSNGNQSLCGSGGPRRQPIT